MMTEHSDEYILSLIEKNDTREKGITLLIDKYKERIYWHIRRLVVSQEDAEDIMQDTFINVFRFIDSFERSSKLYTWLYKIATNECIKLFRKKRRVFSSLEETSPGVINSMLASNMEEGDEIVVRFQKAILKLPEKQRLVFNLRYYDELPYDEISKILGTKVGSLKTSYHYAYEKIKEEMLNNKIL